MMASRALWTATLSSKSTPSKVGGTVGFLARNAADSGVGIFCEIWCVELKVGRRGFPSCSNWIEERVWSEGMELKIERDGKSLKLVVMRLKSGN